MRVFIFGAGVAKSYGGPLLKEVLPEAIKSAANKRGNKTVIKKINKVLCYVFPVNCDPLQHIYPDIETVLTTLDVWRNFNSTIQKQPKFSDWEIEEVRRLIVRLVTEHLSPLADNARADSAIQRFASQLRTGDVVITFNWDLGLESAIDSFDPDLEWDYFWDPRSSKGLITILKAHGSIDWFKTEDICELKKREREPLDPNIGEISVLNWWDYEHLHIAKERTPYIIPPTHHKTFTEKEILNIWRGMGEVLRLADYIYILGYSLPVADLQVRLVLRSSIEKNRTVDRTRDSIYVINPERSVKTSFEELGLDFKFVLSRFEAIDFHALLRDS